MNLDTCKKVQDFPALIHRLELSETIDRRCESCENSKAEHRTTYDFSSTKYLLLRFAIFDNQLRKREVDFSGHLLDGQEMFGMQK